MSRDKMYFLRGCSSQLDMLNPVTLPPIMCNTTSVNAGSTKWGSPQTQLATSKEPPNKIIESITGAWFLTVYDYNLRLWSIKVYFIL